MKTSNDRIGNRTRDILARQVAAAARIYSRHPVLPGTAVAQWLRCCATNRKVAGSILAGVSGFFFDIKSSRSQYGPEVDSASKTNEYQKYFLEVKAAGA